MGDKKCLTCSRIYHVVPAREKTSKYCSRDCQHKAFTIKYGGVNNPMYGKKRPDLSQLNKSKEHIEKVTKFHKGRKRSEEIKKEIGRRSREARMRSGWWQGLDNPTKLSNYNGNEQPNYQIPKKLRKQVLERDNYQCSNCNYNKDIRSLHTHHIIPRRNGGKNILSNLITLCRKCHFEIDYKLIQQEKKGNISIINNDN